MGVFLGLAGIVVLVYYTGFKPIAEALHKGGFALALLLLLYPLEILPRAYAWYIIFPLVPKPGYRFFLKGMWLGQSVNRLLPTASLGGDVVRARLLLLRRQPQAPVLASLIADKTAHATSTLTLLLAGLALLATRVSNPQLMWAMWISAFVLVVLIILFIRLQTSTRASVWLEKWQRKGQGVFSNAGDTARQVEQYLKELYRKPGLFTASVAVRVLYNAALAAEIYFAAALMQSPVSWAEALTLRLVSFSVRSMAFMIWGGLGVQEGAYALLSSFVGLTPGTLVALSLATRVREIGAAIPGVITWLAGEGKRFYHQSSGGNQASAATKQPYNVP